MIIKTEQDSIKSYLTDASNITGNADKVFIPESIDEINEILANCYSENLPITISAGGTGTTGSRVPFSDAVLSVEKLNKIIDLDKSSHTVTVEPGVIVKDLQEFLSDNGYLYPPNPTEINSMVGGNVATNASGARTFKYGSTRDFVQELDVVLMNGDELNLKRGEKYFIDNHYVYQSITGKTYLIPYKQINFPNTTKNAAGYFVKENMELIDLFIGSEGTLGVIKKIKLKLIQKPENELGIVIFFKDESNLRKFVSKARDKSLENNDIIEARLIEYFDNESLNFQREIEKSIPIDATCAIWVEQEYSLKDEEILIEKWYELILEYCDLPDDIWIALSENEKRKLYEFRHALPLSVDEKISKMNIPKISLDTCVNNSLFNDYIIEYDEILKSSGISYCKWGHIGDSHLHTNLFPKTEEEHIKSLETYDLIIDKTLQLNGTISAEHGIGKIKKNYFLKMFGNESVNYFKEIKKVFDNKGLLNQYNIFD